MSVHRIYILANVLFVIYLLNTSSVNGVPIGNEASLSLYNSSDQVTVLDADNFYDKLLGKSHAWLLQFYSAYCGHCIAFAPALKEFAKNISDWGHTVQTAVLNCADDRNTGLCRKYEVFGYPTLAMLPANVAKDDLGSHLGPTTRTVATLKQSVVTYLTDQQKAGNGTSSWVHLLPFRGEKVWAEAGPKEMKRAVMVLDTEGGDFARQVLLHLGHYSKDVLLRWGVKGSALVKAGDGPVPRALLLDRTSDALQAVPCPAVCTPYQLASAVLRHLHLSSSAPPPLTGVGKQGVRGDALNTDRLSYDDSQPDSFYRPTHIPQQLVDLADIESALSMALRQEVALHKQVAGEALQSLKAYLQLLVEHLPVRPQVHVFLSDLSRAVAGHRGAMTNAEYSAALAQAGGTFPVQREWQGCRGSEPHLRGFPCALWTTFHALTVSHAAAGGSEPLAALQAIHGYVKHFFSCTHCSQHFQQMYAKDVEMYVKTASDSILWLWKSHNEVNLRLSGENTEDPKHPKELYPPKSVCLRCWKGDSSRSDPFKLVEVLTFLKNTYSKDSFSLGEVAASSRDGGPRKRSGGSEGSESWTEEVQWCLVLYSATTILLVVLCTLLIVRRRLTRKRFIQLHKNP